jgi:hypothetical protein
MRPDAKNLPATASQNPSHASIPFSVAKDFRIPVSRIGARTAVTPATAVPKATINKHGDAMLPKNEVWLAKQFLVSPPTGNIRPAKNFNQTHLSAEVSAAADQ